MRWTAHPATVRSRGAGVLVLEIDGHVPVERGDSWRISERRISGRIESVRRVGREVRGHDYTVVALGVGPTSTGLFVRGLPLELEVGT